MVKFPIKQLDGIWDSVHATELRTEIKKEVVKRVNEWLPKAERTWLSGVVDKGVVHLKSKQEPYYAR